jgi:integrase/recombinase XerC
VDSRDRLADRVVMQALGWVPGTRLAEINHVAATTGNNPALDALLLRLHTETACRRGGALALRPADLDSDQCLILLREKGDTIRWQPVSPTLIRHLQAHAVNRHAPTTGQLLRHRDGHPITDRRYDTLPTLPLTIDGPQPPQERFRDGRQPVSANS